MDIVGKTKNGKTASPRLREVTRDELLEYIRVAGLRNPKDRLFPWLHAASDSSVWRRTVFNAARARVFDEDSEFANVTTTEVGRHTFVSMHLAAGRTSFEVAQLIGDEEKMIHRHYGHLISEYQDMPPIDIDVELARHRESVRSDD